MALVEDRNGVEIPQPEHTTDYKSAEGVEARVKSTLYEITSDTPELLIGILRERINLLRQPYLVEVHGGNWRYLGSEDPESANRVGQLLTTEGSSKRLVSYEVRRDGGVVLYRAPVFRSAFKLTGEKINSEEKQISLLDLDILTSRLGAQVLIGNPENPDSANPVLRFFELRGISMAGSFDYPTNERETNFSKPIRGASFNISKNPLK